MASKRLTGTEVTEAFRKLMIARLERMDVLSKAFHQILSRLSWTEEELDAKARKYVGNRTVSPDVEELRYMAVMDEVAKEDQR